MRSTAIFLLLVFACGGIADAQGDAAPKTVRCVFPGATLSAALGDLAVQLRCEVDYGDDEEILDLETEVWVVAPKLEPEQAVRILAESAGVSLTLDTKGRKLRCRDTSTATSKPVVRGYVVKPLTDAYRTYCNRYATKPADDDAPATAAEELLHLVQDLTVPETGDRAGSAVGSRLIYSRSADEHAEIKELLTLIGSATGGESTALARDREFRDKLRRNAPRGLGAGNTLGAALWRLFENADMPVYLHRSLLDTIYFEDAAGVADENADGMELLMRVALLHEFSIDSRHGAMRLHDLQFEGTPTYRVFAVDTLLAELDREYEEMAKGASDADAQSLRSRGGVDVLVDAIETQLSNLGLTTLVLPYGARVVVTGGSEIVDAAANVLRELGWKDPAQAEETKK